MWNYFPKYTLTLLWIKTQISALNSQCVISANTGLLIKTKHGRIMRVVFFIVIQPFADCVPWKSCLKAFFMLYLVTFVCVPRHSLTSSYSITHFTLLLTLAFLHLILAPVWTLQVRVCSILYCYLYYCPSAYVWFETIYAAAGIGRPRKKKKESVGSVLKQLMVMLCVTKASREHCDFVGKSRRKSGDVICNKVDKKQTFCLFPIAYYQSSLNFL